MHSIRVVTDELKGTHEAWLGSRCLASTRDFAHRSLRDVWDTATDEFRSLDGPALIYRRRLHDTESGVRFIDHTVALRNEGPIPCRRY